MDRKVYSYDVFDTCLIRKCVRQVLFFELLAKKVLGACARAVRLYYEDNEFYRSAADFVAPIYLPFVHSLLLDATRRNINKLFLLHEMVINYIKLLIVFLAVLFRQRNNKIISLYS